MQPAGACLLSVLSCDTQSAWGGGLDVCTSTTSATYELSVVFALHLGEHLMWNFENRLSWPSWVAASSSHTQQADLTRWTRVQAF